MTYPKSIGQIELNFPFKPGSQAGQSKNDDPNGTGKTRVLGALYPFGYGLSYTTFEMSNLKLSASEIRPQETLQLTVDVKNIGTRKGDEVVQLYLKDLISSVTTYETVLRGFERVSLASGESKTVSFMLKPDDLAILDKQMKWTVEPGKFEVMIGASSEDIKLKKGFSVIN
jgi:beta-glucosidase